MSNCPLCPTVCASCFPYSYVMLEICMHTHTHTHTHTHMMIFIDSLLRNLLGSLFITGSCEWCIIATGVLTFYRLFIQVIGGTQNLKNTSRGLFVRHTHLGPYQYKKHRGRSMRSTILPYAVILTKDHSQYNGQGVYCGLSTASEVFLIFYYPKIPIFWCVSYISTS